MIVGTLKERGWEKRVGSFWEISGKLEQVGDFIAAKNPKI